MNYNWIIKSALIFYNYKIFNLYKISELDWAKVNDRFQFVLFNKFIVIEHIMMFWFIIYNFRGVNFKDWIFDILWGYKLIEYYKQSSIFIVSNWLHERNKDSHIRLIDSENIESSGSNYRSTIQVDYEDNDDYMKNFKMNYAAKQGLS